MFPIADLSYFPIKFARISTSDAILFIYFLRQVKSLLPGILLLKLLIVCVLKLLRHFQLISEGNWEMKINYNARENVI